MRGLDVVFRSWKEPGDMALQGYAVVRYANEFIQPLRDQLYAKYEELQAYVEDGEDEWPKQIAELKGECRGLAFAIASFFNKDRPNINEVRTATHNRWLEDHGAD